MLRNVISMFDLSVPKSWVFEVKCRDLMGKINWFLEDPINRNEGKKCDTWRQARSFLVRLCQACFSPYGTDVSNQTFPQLLARCLTYYYSNLVNDYVAWGILEVSSTSGPRIPPVIFLTNFQERSISHNDWNDGATWMIIQEYTQICMYSSPKLASSSNFIIWKAFLAILSMENKDVLKNVPFNNLWKKLPILKYQWTARLISTEFHNGVHTPWIGEPLHLSRYLLHLA